MSFKTVLKLIGMCFVTLLEKDLLIQYLHAKTFLHGAFDHILKVVYTCLVFLKGLKKL